MNEKIDLWMHIYINKYTNGWINEISTVKYTSKVSGYVAYLSRWVWVMRLKTLSMGFVFVGRSEDVSLVWYLVAVATMDAENRKWKGESCWSYLDCSRLVWVCLWGTVTSLDLEEPGLNDGGGHGLCSPKSDGEWTGWEIWKTSHQLRWRSCCTGLLWIYASIEPWGSHMLQCRRRKGCSTLWQQGCN